ncbi:MAG: RHS repeat-associated core domain-containing protein, partial [Bacteroidales bacterium]|nr:RHS repeat-associated core domain-containing protein [Bacteroidales bacterium]
VIQSVSDNHLGGTDRVSMLYDFPGKILKTIELHTPDMQEFTQVKKRYEYDHAGRLIRVFHQVNGENEVVLFENEYNELGRLITKNLHGTGNSFAQEVNYSYNIRGWLTKINKTESLGNDLFAMDLGYESGIGGLGAEAQYNGNISSTSWETAGNSTNLGFGYKYDRLNRLTSATFGEYAGGWGPSSEDHSVPHIGYDLNGNIDSLKRMGLTNAGQFGVMDDLTYYYEGNRLVGVDDEAPYNLNRYDFTDGLSKYSGNPGEPEYGYDANGNMISDNNKGIQEILYNHLNLPAEIYLEKDRAIRYLYDANGNKLRKIVFGEQGHIEYIRDYSESFVYIDGAIDFILTDEGRINNKVEGLTYEYFLKDHLGNTRVSFEVDNGAINTTGETHYYPFGMTLHGLNQPLRRHRDPVKSQYLYNGKELQSDNGLEWYDYGARFYDAVIGRFHTIDPLSEWHFKHTPYHYTFNNPVNFIDPYGLDTTILKTVEGVPLFYIAGVDINRESLLKRLFNIIKGVIMKLDAGGNGEIQNGGIPLVSESGGASPARTRAENSDEPVNVDNLLPALGGAGAGSLGKPTLAVASGLKQVKGVVDEVSGNNNRTSDKKIKESTGDKTDANGKPVKYANTTTITGKESDSIIVNVCILFDDVGGNTYRKHKRHKHTNKGRFVSEPFKKKNQ